MLIHFLDCLDRGPANDHLAAFGCPEFIVEFNTLSIIAVLSQVAYSSFAGMTSIQMSGYKH